jgi:hypothetical protein
VCGNRLTLPIDRVDRAVLETMAGKVLNPPIVDAVIAGVLESLRTCHASERGTGLPDGANARRGRTGSADGGNCDRGGADRVTARGGEGATGEAR